MANKYLGYPFVVDARQLMANAFSYVKTKIPGWQPSEGQLDVWIIEATAGEAADIGTLVSQVPKALFRYLGTLYGILPENPASAAITSTWFMIDNLGHTIPAGTQVSIADSGGVQQPFTVISDVIVPGGSTQTTAGQVQLIATYPGLAATGLGSIGGTVNLIDSLAWVDHITQTDVTAGGADGETDDAYLDRLAVELRTVSPRPILPNDFAILARNVPGVQRAVALDGYNPADGTFNNERYTTVVCMDATGLGISAPEKTAVQTYLDGLREINFVVRTADPSVNQIDCTVHFKCKAGWAVSDVQDLVQGTLDDFFDPLKWGVNLQGDDPTAPISWDNVVVVREYELATAVNNTQGVDYITLLTFGPHLGIQTSNDLALTGVVPLPSLVTSAVVGS